MVQSNMARKRKRKQNHHHEKRSKSKTGRSEKGIKTISPTTTNPIPTSSSKAHANVELPLAFPRYHKEINPTNHANKTSQRAVKLPSKGFLRNVDPYKESFQLAVDTSYEGLAFDIPTLTASASASASLDLNTKSSSPFEHDRIQSAFQCMDDHGFFRVDVTQPFGLGTRCARTHVTRCLLGDNGTTYKYLGLRMFSTPWSVLSEVKKNDVEVKNAGRSYKKSGDDTTTMELDEALSNIRSLNETLSKRTEVHLTSLEEKRRGRHLMNTCQSSNTNSSRSFVKGRSNFDITLINRMEFKPSLKKEPTMGEERAAVSWHADSSLEHYSTIAVYHSIISKERQTDQDAKAQSSPHWSVALRVAHHSEGPTSSNRGKDTDSLVVKETPPIAVSLPSGSAYYLLDDFNHHHQHAVLVSHPRSTQDAGVRFASTHRLLREGHNVAFILERCRNCCSQFHKKGPKVWRSEQLLLTEIENDWIRQFYIQGEEHREQLWKFWGKAICDLLQYWSQLELRTKQVLDMLRYASEGRCYLLESKGKDSKDSGNAIVTRSDKKVLEKRKKALRSVAQILGRGIDATESSDDTSSVKALEILFNPFKELFEDRTKMRYLWSLREKDHAFKALAPECRPLQVPLTFNHPHTSSNKGSKEMGFSPLPGSIRELEDVASQLTKYGEAFVSKNQAHLPSPASCSIQQPYSMSSQSNSREDFNKPLVWSGWKSKSMFGLEMQEPWAGKLLDGTKVIETRAYDLPKALLGKKIYVLESRAGTDGVSNLGDVLNLDEAAVSCVGYVTFDKVITYRYRAKFEADEGKHLVAKGSPYGWSNEKGKIIYGWVVGKKYQYGKKDQIPTANTRLIRRMRSLFEFCDTESATSHH